MNPFPWYATELFLSICDAGGLSAASRFGKISISQPALSAQMAQLEHFLGVTLFQRKPFQLTKAGEKFYEEALRLRLRMGLLKDSLLIDDDKPLRIAASDIIIRNYLPELLKELDTKTRTRHVLREAPSQDLAQLVRDDEMDIAIGMVSKYVQIGTKPLVEILATLPLVLLVPPSQQREIRTWSDFLKLLKNQEKPGFVALPQNNLLMRHKLAALRKAGIEWNTTIEVSSLSHVAKYVALDFGFGIGIQTPKSEEEEGNGRIAIPIEEMPPLSLGAWYKEEIDPLSSRLLAIIRSFAKKHLPSSI